MITHTDLQQMREYEQKATAGPWDSDQAQDGLTVMQSAGQEKIGDMYSVTVGRPVAEIVAKENADFIARVRTDFPRLIDECEKLLRIAEAAEQYRRPSVGTLDEDIHDYRKAKMDLDAALVAWKS